MEVPRPNRLFFAGLVLVIVGAVLPMLMILDLVPSTMFLNFAAYLSSVIGLFLGILSAASWFEIRRHRDDDPDEPFLPGGGD